MLIFSTILAIMALSTIHSKALDSETKASSPYTNCGCQCSSLTFRDSANIIQGNCMTVDNTGAQWCYVDSSHSSCQDLVPSQRFPHNPWSYEACATPALGSPICPNYPAYPSHPTYPHPALAQPTNVYSPPHGPIVAPAGPVQGVPALPLGPIIGNGALPLGPTLGGGSLPLGPALGGGSGPLGPAFGGGSLPLGPTLGGGSLPFGPALGGGSSPFGPALGGGSFPLGPTVGGPFLGDARQGPVVEGKGTASKLNFKKPTK